jgi:hypothetical protein
MSADRRQRALSEFGLITLANLVNPRDAASWDHDAWKAALDDASIHIMSLTTQYSEGLNTSLQASQSLMRVLKRYDWATNSFERARLESQPYNKLLSAAALALQSYCSRFSMQRDDEHGVVSVM